MNIYCAKCGNFFKNWKLDIIECCNAPMNTLKDPVLGGVVAQKAHYISPDIQPYQAMAFDKETGKAPMITSRREHREFLRKNGYVEIGNETPKVNRPQADHNVRKELTEATREVLAKYR